jgi:hypothetical protein
MALAFDPASASITAKAAGAKAGIHIGTQLALLHCTVNANLNVADIETGGRGDKGPMINFTARVFFPTDPNSGANKIEISKWDFGIIQVSDVQVFQARYAGRRESEGEVTLNLKAGFRANPSLDADEDLPDMIFEPRLLTVTPVFAPKPGFQVEFKPGDNPNNLFPLKIINKATDSPNFLFSARRDEGFITYFVARDPAGKTHHLARIGWHIVWHGTCRWTSPSAKPTAMLLASRIDIGESVNDDPANTAFPAMFAVAKNPQRPTTNECHNEAADKALAENPVPPVHVALKARRSDVPVNFFPPP